MEIRKYREEDLEEKKEVHLKSIREVGADDYSEEQIEAWSDFSDQGSIEEEFERWVAVEKEQIIGFADYRPNEARVTGVYIHPDYIRRGVGSRLLEKILQDAMKRGLDSLSCESSLTARNFYLNHGFEIVEETTHETNGVEMKTFEMRKDLED